MKIVTDRKLTSLRNEIYECKKYAHILMDNIDYMEEAKDAGQLTNLRIKMRTDVTILAHRLDNLFQQFNVK